MTMVDRPAAAMAAMTPEPYALRIRLLNVEASPDSILQIPLGSPTAAVWRSSPGLPSPGFGEKVRMQDFLRVNRQCFHPCHFVDGLGESVEERNRPMKNDLRVRYTQKVIQEAFWKILKEKPLAKITVKEICDLAEINRGTFYKH